MALTAGRSRRGKRPSATGQAACFTLAAMMSPNKMAAELIAHEEAAMWMLNSVYLHGIETAPYDDSQE